MITQGTKFNIQITVLEEFQVVIQDSSFVILYPYPVSCILYPVSCMSLYKYVTYSWPNFNNLEFRGI